MTELIADTPTPVQSSADAETKILLTEILTHIKALEVEVAGLKRTLNKRKFKSSLIVSLTIILTALAVYLWR